MLGNKMGLGEVRVAECRHGKGPVRRHVSLLKKKGGVAS